MSLYGATLSFLAIKPKVAIRDGMLIARTCMLIQALWLFSYCKHVVVTQKTKTTVIRWRFLWFLSKTRKIPAERLRAVGYGYKGTATSWSVTGQTTDSIDTFKVMLVLNNPFERIHLFNFTGEGANFTGMTGVILHGDNMADHSGDQEETSRNYVELLQSYLELGLESVY